MSDEVWTAVRCLQWATGYLKQKGVGSPRLDAELIISHVIRTDRMGVYLQYDRPLSAEELNDLRHLILQRAERIPVAYLIGWREFYRHRFKVTPDVLIPRPETELLVESTVHFLNPLPEDQRTVLDLGTGSGCIAISVALEMPCRVWAVDRSEKALAVARENAQQLGCRGIQFRQGDWFDALNRDDPKTYSVIVSNPPYVAPEDREDLEPEVHQEPKEALFAGGNVWEAYEKIASHLSAYLREDGMAVIEINAKYADKIMEVFQSTGFAMEIHGDLRGLPRILRLNRPAS